MPAEVRNDLPGISCVFSDGRRATVILGDAASPRLARDLLTGLAELIHPHGTVDSAGTVRHFTRALCAMDSALAARGFAGGAAGRVLDGHHGGQGILHPADAPGLRRGRGNAGRESPGAGRGTRVQPAALPPPAAALSGGHLAAADGGQPGRGDGGLPGAPGRPGRGRTRAGPRDGGLRPGQPAVAAGSQRPHVDSRRRGARGNHGRRDPAGEPAGRDRAVPAPGRHHRLPAAVQRLLGHRPRRHR